MNVPAGVSVHGVCGSQRLTRTAVLAFVQTVHFDRFAPTTRPSVRAPVRDSLTVGDKLTGRTLIDPGSRVGPGAADAMICARLGDLAIIPAGDQRQGQESGSGEANHAAHSTASL